MTEEEHARIVEERKRKEQPCRTLFIRNVKVSYVRGELSWSSEGSTLGCALRGLFPSAKEGESYPPGS